MNYHLIKSDDMLNGEGLRVTLFVSGCEHKCQNCHNPETHDVNSGDILTDEKVQEIIKILSHDYISGITLSGGDPLHTENVYPLYNLLNKIKEKYNDTKNIWIYTGYTWENIFSTDDSEESNLDIFFRRKVVSMADVLVDGKFIESLADINYCWAGSTNQRVIDVKESLKENKVILWSEEQ